MLLRRRRFLLAALVATTMCPTAACRSWDREDDAYDPYRYDSTPYEQPKPPPNPYAPTLGTTRVQSDAPPPISGGTLIVSHDGERAIAADPDRDHVFIAKLDDRSVVGVPLTPHDEPGRLIEDDAGRVHVVLRRAGAIVSIDVKTGTVLGRRDACKAPRGIAFDAPRKRLLIACEDGQLLAMTSVPASTTAPVRLAVFDEGDLRDVIVSRDHTRIFVSRFRAAEIVEVSVAGKEIARTKLPLRGSPSTLSFPPVFASGSAPMLAWRMIAPPAEDPSDDPIVVHEIGMPGPGRSTPQSYYGAGEPSSCSTTAGPIALSALSRPGIGGFMTLLPSAAVLPVDVATDGRSYAIVAAGNGHTKALPRVFIAAASSSSSDFGGCPDVTDGYSMTSQATAVVFRRDGALIVQSREPARLELLPERIEIPLSPVSREDTGHAIFHSNSGTGLACASCHAEGGDDGHVWEFFEGRRRTPSLRGTIEGTSPYHWSGDVADIDKLSELLMTERMGGPELRPDQKNALRGWLFAIPPPAKSDLADTEAANRGRAIFERPDVQCASCHSGDKLTSSESVNVGTGGTFQVPSLIGLRFRAPFMHDGCATTLRDRFDPACGGASHGKTSQLTAEELDDLIRYLESL